MSGADIAKLVLDYLRVILSWPVATLVIATVVLKLFKIPIEALIGRIASIKVPGIGEFTLSQSERNLVERLSPSKPEPNEPENPPPVAAVPLPPPANPAEPAATAPVPAPAAAPVNVQDTSAFKAERERAYLWEYRYLNHFLVPRTQFVLDWIANRTDGQPLSYATYDSWLLPFVPDASERHAMLEALQQHHLVLIDANGVITVSPKGREYVQWRGPADRVAKIWTALRTTPPVVTAAIPAVVIPAPPVSAGTAPPMISASTPPAESGPAPT